MSKRKIIAIESDSEDSELPDGDSLLSISSLDSDYDLSSGDDSSEQSDDEVEAPPIDVPWINTGIPRPYFPFTSASGIQIPMADYNDVLQIFEHFIDEDFVHIIVEETNRYLIAFIVFIHVTVI